MRMIAAILIASVAFGSSGQVMAAQKQAAKPVAVTADSVPPKRATKAQDIPEGYQATGLSCIVTDDGQAIVVNSLPEGVKGRPVIQRKLPDFDPYKQKLAKFEDKADGQRCVREPILAELTEDEQRTFLKGQWDKWFGPAAALILDQQNQIRKLQNLPPLTQDQLMDEVRKLPRK